MIAGWLFFFGWLLTYGVTLNSWCIIYLYNSLEFVWWVVYSRLWDKAEADSGLVWISFLVQRWLSYIAPKSSRWVDLDLNVL